jgi:hypothetical protein
MPPGGVPELVSVGSATFAVAVTPHGSFREFYVFNGTTWTKTLTIPAGIPFWAEACEDGAYWYALGPTLRLKLPEKEVPFTLPDIAARFGQFAAGSRYACHYVAGLGLTTAVYGLLDEPAAGWPALTAGEGAAYNAINQKLKISDPAGVRGQYRNTIASVSAWYTDVTSMPQPAGVSASDWTSVRDTVAAELQAVESVHKLFVNLKLLNNAVGLRLSEARQRVTMLVGLPEEQHAQPKTPIDLALESLLEKAFDAAISKVPAEMSKVVNVAVSLAKNAADREAKALGAPSAGTTLQIACADLVTTLAAVQRFTGEETENTVDALLVDQRKLLAAGHAISSGFWYWPPKFDVKIITDAGTAAELQMLQMLMPVRWSILQFQTLFTTGSIIPSPRPWPEHAPALALMFKKVLDSKANMLCWWWVCAADGAPPRRETTGPFPNQGLIDAIMKLATPLDFFTGRSGWRLPVRTQDGYTPAPDGVPFEPWVNRNSPLQ